MAQKLAASMRKVDRILKNGRLTGNFDKFAQAQTKSLELRQFLSQCSALPTNNVTPKGSNVKWGWDIWTAIGTGIIGVSSLLYIESNSKDSTWKDVVDDSVKNSGMQTEVKGEYDYDSVLWDWAALGVFISVFLCCCMIYGI